MRVILSLRKQIQQTEQQQESEVKDKSAEVPTEPSSSGLISSNRVTAAIAASASATSFSTHVVQKSLPEHTHEGDDTLVGPALSSSLPSKEPLVLPSDSVVTSATHVTSLSRSCLEDSVKLPPFAAANTTSPTPSCPNLNHNEHKLLPSKSVQLPVQHHLAEKATGIPVNLETKPRATPVTSATAAESTPTTPIIIATTSRKRNLGETTGIIDSISTPFEAAKVLSSAGALKKTKAIHHQQLLQSERKLPASKALKMGLSTNYHGQNNNEDNLRDAVHNNRMNPANCFDDEHQENNPASARGDFVCSQQSTIVNDAEMDSTSSFETALKKKGLEIKEQDGDGNCLFRAVSLQVYGDANMHGEVRKRCLDFMAADKEHFSQFITDEIFEQYLDRKRSDGVHGNNPEIQAVSELFNRPVEVFVTENGANPLNIFHAEYKTGDAPIRLSYHDGNHYNAVVDPLCPTAGLGLGLPGLEPGLADRMQVAKAVQESDKLADEEGMQQAMKESHDDQLQRAIKESSFSFQRRYKEKAMALSDMEATEMELEQAVLESSLESYQQTELGRKKPSTGRIRRNLHHHERSLPTNNNSNSGMASLRLANPQTFPASIVASSPPCDNVANANESSSFTTASTTVTAPARASASACTPAAASAHQESSHHRFEAQQHDEYPQTVQELVMNGFQLSKVVRAYELIGDNFDDILSFLMSSSS